MIEMKPYKLGDICTDIAYGYTESASWENIGPKFLRITDIQNYFIDWKNVPHCPITEDNHKKYKLELGDIVIARTGATTGVTSIFKDAEIDSVFASYLIRYKINRELANPFYIGYILKSPFWKSYVDSIIGGSAQPGANAKQFAAFNLRLPSLTIQNSIVEILSSMDNKIELNLAIYNTLESTIISLFKEWFVNFKFPGFDGKLVNGLPKDWKMGSLSNFVALSKASVTPSDFPDKEYFHYSIPAFDENKIPVRELGKAILSNKFVVKNKSILISKLNPRFPRLWSIGEVNEDNSICSTEFLVLIPKNPNFYSYPNCYFKLDSTIETIKGLASGTSGSHQRIKPEDMLNLAIVIPPDNILVEFEKTVKALVDRQIEVVKENQTLSNLRSTILPNIIRGVIEIKE